MQNYRSKAKASLYNSGDLTAVLSSAGTWFPLSGTMLSSVTQGFTYSSAVLTCTKPAWYQFSGDASLAPNKACRVSFGLFLNGAVSPVAGLTTPMDVVNSSKLCHFGANQIIQIASGDTVTVKASTDTATTTLTVSSLNISLTEC